MKIFIWEHQSLLDFDIFDIYDSYATAQMVAVAETIDDARTKLLNRLEKDEETVGILALGLKNVYKNIICNNEPSIIVPIEDAYISDLTTVYNNEKVKQETNNEEIDMLKKTIESLDEEELYDNETS